MKDLSSCKKNNFENKKKIYICNEAFSKHQCWMEGALTMVKDVIKKMQDKNSPVRFFVGTPQTGGYGITLTAGSNMIYFSNGYDLEKRQQSEARIDRIGQTRKMTYIDIMSQDTIDERIISALAAKDVTQSDLLKALKHKEL